jgi:hypothetical protein
MREALREGDLPTRLRSARVLLRMSGLQAAVQTEKQPSQEQIINEFLREVIRKVAQEVGIYNPKRLPGEVQRSPAVYTVGSQKIIMKISSSCFTRIAQEYYPDHTIIDWYSFLNRSKTNIH